MDGAASLEDASDEATPAAPERPDEAATDGRSLRRKRNRDAVIVALLDLVREGNFEPSTTEIADRANVSHRSVFRYFDDLSDLVRTAIDYEIAKVTPLAELPDVGQGPLERRIDTLVRSRLSIYNHTHSIGRVARARALAIPAIDDGMKMIANLFRDQLSQQFGPELDRLPPDEASRLVDAVHVAVSFESFDIYRRRFDHDDETIAGVWRTALAALLRP